MVRFIEQLEPRRLLAVSAISDVELLVVDLSATIGQVAIKPVKVGKRGGAMPVPLTLLNSGNATLKATTGIELFVSTNATFGDADDLAAGAPPLVLNLGPAKTKVIRKTAKLPPTLPSGAYYVMAVLDARDAIPESNEANNLAFSTTRVTVINTVLPTGIASVSLDGIEIKKGQSAPVNLGSALQNLTGPAKTFTVTNVGQYPLTLGDITLPAGFDLDDSTAGLLNPGESDTFTVHLNTTTLGARTGNILLTTGDPKRNPYNFKLAGLVSIPPTPTLDSALHLDTDAVPLAEAEQIVFTASVAGSNPTVIVEVDAVDSGGIVLNKVVDLYDDGSALHDDAVAGDGIFSNSTAIMFDTPGERYFIARFPDDSQRTAAATLSAIATPTPEQLQQRAANNALLKDIAVAEINAGKSDAQVLSVLKATLLAWPPDLVVPESISLTTTSIRWSDANGLLSVINVVLLRESVAFAPAPAAAAAVRTAAGATREAAADCACGDAFVMAEAEPTDQLCKQATVISPYLWRKTVGDDSSSTFTADLASKGWNVNSRLNVSQAGQNVSVEDFKTLSASKMIVISSFVEMDERLGGLILTGQPANTLVDPIEVNDLLSRRIVEVNGTYAVSRRFISYYNGKFTNAIVYVEGNKSAIDDRLAAPFLAKGATAYLGYTADTYTPLAAATGKKISQTLISGKAVWDIPGIDFQVIDHQTKSRLVNFGPKRRVTLNDKCTLVKDMLLEIQYSWNQAQTDLDTATSFRDWTVGYAAPDGPPGNNYLTWTSGDDRSSGGVETAELDIGRAFTDSLWAGSVSIACAAGWFEPESGSGPALLKVVLRDRNTFAEIESLVKQINPGQQIGQATTLVATITVTTSTTPNEQTARIAFAG